MKHQATTIVRPWSEKLPAFRRIGIASRFCSAAGPLEINSQAADPEHGPDIAFHNRAPVVVAVLGSPGSHGLCSSRAVEVLWRIFPATSLFLCAISLPADRSNSFGNASPMPRLTRWRGKAVFTQTQLLFRKRHIFGLAFMGGKFKNFEDQKVNTIRRLWLSECQAGAIFRGSPIFHLTRGSRAATNRSFSKSNTSMKPKPKEAYE